MCKKFFVSFMNERLEYTGFSDPYEILIHAKFMPIILKKS